MKISEYRVIVEPVTHGRFSVWVIASSKHTALELVLGSEECPEHYIKEVIKVRDLN